MLGQRDSLKVIFSGMFDLSFPGSLVYCLDRVRTLRHLGHEVAFVNILGSRSMQPINPVGKEGDNRVKPPRKLSFLLSEADLIYTWSFTSHSLLGLLRREFRRTPLAVDEPGDDLEKVHSIMKRGTINALLGRVDGLSVASSGYSKYLERNWRIPTRKMSIVRYGVDDGFFDQTLDNIGDRPTIVHSGRIDDFLLRVFDSLLSSQRVQIILVGTSTTRASSLNARHRESVVLMPTVRPERLAPLLHKSSLFVIHYPSNFLGQSVKLQHYMAVGRPMITNHFMVADEYLDASECVFVDNNKGAYVDAISSVLQDSEEYRYIGAKSRAKALRLFGRNVIQGQMSEFLSNFED